MTKTEELVLMMTELNTRLLRDEELLVHLTEIIINFCPEEAQKELADHYLNFLQDWNNSPSVVALRDYLEKQRAANH